MNTNDLSADELRALLRWLSTTRFWVTESSIARWRTDQLPALRRAAERAAHPDSFQRKGFPIESRELHRPTGVRPELAAGYSAETQLSPAEAIRRIGEQAASAEQRMAVDPEPTQRVRSLLDEPRPTLDDDLTRYVGRDVHARTCALVEGNGPCDCEA